jgi:hypothetical protein
MAAMIEYVCTARHERRDEPSARWRRVRGRVARRARAPVISWTRIAPTAVDALRSPSSYGRATLVLPEAKRPSNSGRGS